MYKFFASRAFRLWQCSLFRLRVRISPYTARPLQRFLISGGCYLLRTPVFASLSILVVVAYLRRNNRNGYYYLVFISSVWFNGQSVVCKYVLILNLCHFYLIISCLNHCSWNLVFRSMNWFVIFKPSGTTTNLSSLSFVR